MPNRLLSLDVLRAVAVLLVLFRHARWSDDTNIALRVIARGGGVGVDLFFVLSGFLVSGLLFREFNETGKIKAGRFLLRRGFKIYPAFWCLLAVTVVCRLIVGESLPARATFGELFFLQNYLPNGYWWHPNWSLAVEEHFYLVIPFLLIGLSGDRFAAVPRIAAAAMIALLAARWFHSLAPALADPELQWRRCYAPTHLRFDSLLFGVMLSYFYHYRPQFSAACRRHWLTLLVAGAALLSPPFIYEQFERRWLCSLGLTLGTLGAGAIVSSLVCRGITANGCTKSLALVGRHSYSIYLWHTIIQAWFLPLLGLPEWLETPAFFAASLGLGIQLSRWIEIPALQLRDRLMGANLASGTAMQTSCAS